MNNTARFAKINPKHKNMLQQQIVQENVSSDAIHVLHITSKTLGVHIHQ